MDSAAATVSVTVEAAADNSRPTAFDQTVTLKEDGFALIKLTATEPKACGDRKKKKDWGWDWDGDGEWDDCRLHFKILQRPTHGRVQHGPLPWVVYTPDDNYVGDDSFTFQVSFGRNLSNVATVSLKITPTNDAPKASNLRFITARHTPLTGMLAGSDIDGDALTYRLVNEPDKGNVVLNPATGAFTYTPSAKARGEDDFTYTVNDGTTDGNIGRVHIEIARHEHRRPMASNQQIVLNRQNAYSGQLIASDDDNDDLTFTVVNGPNFGTLTIDADTGRFVYTPKASGKGKVDTFTFQVSDGDADSNVANVRIDMTDNTKK